MVITGKGLCLGGSFKSYSAPTRRGALTSVDRM